MESTNKSGPRKRSVKKKQDIMTKSSELFKTGRQKLESIEFQPILNKVKKGLKIAFESIEKGTEKAAEKTVEVSKQAKIQYSIYTHHNQLQKSLAELGGRIYDLTKENRKLFTPPDSKALDLLAKISDIERKISDLEEKTKSIKKES